MTFLAIPQSSSPPDSGPNHDTMTDSQEVLELFDRIAALIPCAVPFDGVMLRSVGTRYANEGDFLSGRGAAKYGGRWNRAGIRAVYGSLDVMTATYEAYYNFVDYGFSLTSLRPRVLAGARARLTIVLDLTDAAIRRKLGLTLRDLVEEDWQGIQAGGEESWTQAIGRGARAAGFEALLVPSARHRRGKNLVVFPDRLREGSFLKAVMPKDLPPCPSDWP